MDWEGMERDEKGWDGIGRDGKVSVVKGWEKMGWDGKRWKWVRRNGIA